MVIKALTEQALKSNHVGRKQNFRNTVLGIDTIIIGGNSTMQIELPRKGLKVKPYCYMREVGQGLQQL